ncbi:hypothetical protein [Phyllobacterium sp. SB3]|uniref:hypothetical protein n=1 Tax=Phyllobacterium sp. SB3 TaxID=3156073 RepID=UPI0032AFE5DC
MFGTMGAELKGLLDCQIARLKERIEQIMASDNELAATAVSCVPFPGSALSPAPC